MPGLEGYAWSEDQEDVDSDSTASLTSDAGDGSVASSEDISSSSLFPLLEESTGLVHMISRRFRVRVSNAFSGGDEVSFMGVEGEALDGEANGNARFGYYAQVPIFEVLAGCVVLGLKTMVYFLLVAWAHSFARGRLRWMRGLVNVMAIGWSIPICATFTNLVLGTSMTASMAVASAAGFVTICVAIAALPHYFGLVVIVVGGSFVHLCALVLWGIFKLHNGGVAWAEASARALYFFMLFVFTFLNIIHCYILCLLWPWLDGQSEPLAGFVLSVAFTGGEFFYVYAISVADFWCYRRIRNARTMGSWGVMFVHSMSEAFRMVTMWIGVLRAPTSWGYVISLGFSICINPISHLGWFQFVAFRVFRMLGLGWKFWVPGCWGTVHRRSKFAFGYARFGSVVTIVGVRAIVSSIYGSGALCFFSCSVLAVWILSFIAELIEDLVILFAEYRGWVPDWYSDEDVQELVAIRNQEDPSTARVAMAPTADGTLRNKVTPHKRFVTPLICLSITDAVTFMTLTGLVPIIGLQSLLGMTSKHEHHLYNGAIFWS